MNEWMNVSNNSWMAEWEMYKWMNNWIDSLWYSGEFLKIKMSTWKLDFQIKLYHFCSLKTSCSFP